MTIKCSFCMKVCNPKDVNDCDFKCNYDCTQENLCNECYMLHIEHHKKVDCKNEGELFIEKQLMNWKKPYRIGIKGDSMGIF